KNAIRDFHVTGVQTCALPISARLQLVRRQRLDRREELPPFGPQVGLSEESHYAILISPKIRRTSGSKCSSGSVSYAGSNAAWSHSSVNCSARAYQGSAAYLDRSSGSRPS